MTHKHVFDDSVGYGLHCVICGKKPAKKVAIRRKDGVVQRYNTKPKKRIFIRVKPDDMFPKSWMITVQAEGFPESIGYLDDKLQGLGGAKEEIYKIAEELKVEEQKANPDANVIIVR